MKLRNYQITDLERLRQAYRDGFRAPLLTAPTGYGKTVLFCYVAAGVASKGKRVTILCHRSELIDQTVAALRKMDLNAGVIAAGYEENLLEPIQVASVMTLRNRLYRHKDPDLIIIDEAHHCTKNNTWGAIIQHYGHAKRLGVTATPIRLSGEGLADTFDTMIVGPSTRELIDMGYLTKVRVYAPSQPDLTGIRRNVGDYSLPDLEDRIAKSSITGDAITHYKKLCEGRKAIAFCVSVKHANRVAESFTAAGYRAKSIDGSMDKHERKNILEKFRRGEILVLTSCDLVSEGFDVPSIEVGISLRPTTSTGLWIQQVGRCIRPDEGKHTAIILDHAGNSYKHGLPDQDREWELTVTQEKRKKTDEKEEAVRVCKTCFAANKAAATECSECGTVFEIKERKITQSKGELEELKQVEIKKNKQEQGSALSWEALIALGKHRGYKNPQAWANYVIQGRIKRGRFRKYG